jgi:hypothetical protein
MARIARKRVINPYAREIKVNLPTEILRALTLEQSTAPITKLGTRQP